MNNVLSGKSLNLHLLTAIVNRNTINMTKMSMSLVAAI